MRPGGPSVTARRQIDCRNVATGTFLLVALSLACNKGLEHFAPPMGSGVFKPDVDFSPVWSHDGRFIAYRRAFPSTDGPPGVYIVPSSGGRPRFITRGSFFWPGSLRFSPDDRLLAAISDLQLAIIDVATGAMNIPVYTHNYSAYPDWSPDGRQIVYNRIFWRGVPPEPHDSSGIHLYDLATGQDRPIFSNGQVAFGISSRWSPDGNHIAFIYDGTPQAIMLMRPDGSDVHQLIQASRTLFNNLTWFRHPLTGAEGLLYMEENGHMYFVRSDDPSPTRFQLLYAYQDISPDGTQFTVIGNQPSDSLGVVFTMRVNDFTGGSLRQITSYYYAPPASPSSRARQASLNSQVSPPSAIRRFVLLGGK